MKLIKLAIVLGFVITLSIVAMLILKAYGVIYWDAENDMRINKDIFGNFLSSWYGWLIVILVQIIITTLLCFVPGASMAFIFLIDQIFEKSWQAFLVAFGGVLLSSLIMYLLGRLGGYKICEFLLGKEDCDKASKLLNNKGAIYFPLMMMFPIFPDDALVMIAGTLKMSMKWFIPSIVIGRGIGIATIVFGLGNIPFDKFTSGWHWAGFVTICAVLIIAVFYSAYRFNKFLDARAKAKERANEQEKETQNT